MTKAELFAWAMRHYQDVLKMTIKDIQAQLKSMGRPISYASEMRTVAQATELLNAK